MLKFVLLSCCIVVLLSQVTFAKEQEGQQYLSSKTKCEVLQTENNEGDEDCLFHNWYVTGALGFARGGLSTGDIQSAASSLGFNVFDIVTNTNRTAAKVAIGTSLTDQMSLELGYVDLGEVDAAFSTNTDFPERFFELTNNIHPTSTSGITLSGVYQFYQQEDWFLQLRLGLLFWNGDYDSLDVFANREVDNNSDSNGEDIYFGFGGNYQLKQNLQLIVEWERYSIDSENTDLLSVGLTYHF